MIAIREDLDITCKQINIKCPAEILSIEIKLFLLVYNVFYHFNDLLSY